METVPPLVDEAMKKAAVAWIEVAGRPAFAVWCLWSDGALYVVSGPGEQPAPGLSDSKTVTVSARGDHGGRIVSWPATVRELEPESADWAAVVPQLAAKRLNSPGTAEATAARWAAECVVNRLVPAGAPEPLPDDSEAAPPVPSPATRLPRRPFRLHRVRNTR